MPGVSVPFLRAGVRPRTAQLADLAGEAHRRMAFVVVVCGLTGVALVLANVPAWAFAVAAPAFGARVCIAELGAQDARAAALAREDEHVADIQRRAQAHRKRIAELEARHRAEVDRYEHLVAELRSGDGERR